MTARQFLGIAAIGLHPIARQKLLRPPDRGGQGAAQRVLRLQREDI
jgi:hypothetical protein